MEIDNNEFAVQILNDHKKKLLERRERLLLPLQQLDQEIEHVAATIRSLQPKPEFQTPISTVMMDDFPIGKLRKLTQVQALVAIAKHYGGTFRAQFAKRLLIRAGVMRETKNSTNVIHAVILRSERFERVRPGEYRLREHGSSSDPTEGGDKNVFRTTGPVV